MSTRIEFDIHTPFGRAIAELTRTLVSARNQSTNLKASIDSMANGGSFAQVEAEIGGMAAGTGEALYNLLTDINQKLVSNTLDGIYRLHQG